MSPPDETWIDANALIKKEGETGSVPYTWTAWLFFFFSGRKLRKETCTLFSHTVERHWIQKMTWAQLRRQQLCLDNVTSARFPQPHVLTFSPLREKEEESDHLSPFANREKTKEGQRKKLRMFRISFHGSRTREAAKQRVSSYLFCIFRSLQTPRPSEKAQKTFLFIWGPICIPRSSFYSFPFS